MKRPSSPCSSTTSSCGYGCCDHQERASTSHGRKRQRKTKAGVTWAGTTRPSGGRSDSSCDEAPSVKTEVQEIPSVMTLSNHPKEHFWVQSTDLQAALESMRQECLLLRTSGGCMEKSYVSALAETFVCCLSHSKDDDHEKENQHEDEFATSKAPHRQIAVLATMACQARGLESGVVPELALERAQRRRSAIASVVQLDCLLRQRQQQHQDEELLRTVSESLSGPARRFARCLAMADESAALVVEPMQGGKHEIQATTSYGTVAVANKHQESIVATFLTSAVV